MKLTVKILRIFGIVSPLIIVAVLVTGAIAPFHDREGRCTLCGKRILEKTSPWLDQPITHTFNTRLSVHYENEGLPEHEHNWEFMGGYMDTNFYGFPAVYEFDRTDSLLLVSDDYLLEILRRLEFRDAQIEFLRAVNCDDEYVRTSTRAELYAHYPGRVGSFIAWWDAFMDQRGGLVPCELLPGPPRESRQRAWRPWIPPGLSEPLGSEILNMN